MNKTTILIFILFILLFFLFPPYNIILYTYKAWLITWICLSILFFLYILYMDFSSVYSNVNNSKLLAGITMLILNVGAKYVEINFSKTQEAYLRSALGREILLFSICFMATHDIITAILLTAAFVILADIFFNEDSKYCIIPEKLNKLKNIVDTNNDGVISSEELQYAQNLYNKSIYNK